MYGDVKYAIVLIMKPVIARIRSNSKKLDPKDYVDAGGNCPWVYKHWAWDCWHVSPPSNLLVKSLFFI